MDALDIDYLPSRGQLESIGMIELSRKLCKAGFKKVANAMGLANKRVVGDEKWTIESAKARIIEIKDALQLDRMPTQNEVRSVEGNYSLSSYISRGEYGYSGFAEILGLQEKYSETLIGKRHESIAKEKLEELGYTVEQMSMIHPYDLLMNGAIKIDVKFSYLYYGPQGNFYRFSWDKKHHTCDIYLLVTKISPEDEKEIYRVVPAHHIKNVSGISIGEISSIYDKYINRWDILKTYAEFFEAN